jgi:hypothetical protein
LIGDWFEEWFVVPLLETVANELGLYLDHRFRERAARGKKILWKDADGNEVDYDFVLELGGTDEMIGIPVGFVECFWRRGSRHSMDKARDDTGKLSPMRACYPTARFLGIVSAGDFTGPAREYVRTREIDLFYVPKKAMVEAFAENGLLIDYPDGETEAAKRRLVNEFHRGFDTKSKANARESLIATIGKATVRSYIDRVRSAISALPQEVRFVMRRDSAPVVFSSVADATAFLKEPEFPTDTPSSSYVYNVVFSDGAEFERDVTSIEELTELHRQIAALSEHMNALNRSDT